MAEGYINSHNVPQLDVLQIFHQADDKTREVAIYPSQQGDSTGVSEQVEYLFLRVCFDCEAFAFYVQQLPQVADGRWLNGYLHSFHLFTFVLGLTLRGPRWLSLPSVCARQLLFPKRCFRPNIQGDFYTPVCNLMTRSHLSE